MSFTSVDFPDPLTPVTAVSTPSGNATSMPFRLFALAARMVNCPCRWGRRTFGVAMMRSPRRYIPVSEASPSPTSSDGVPWKTTFPPCSPAPLPRSTT